MRPEWFVRATAATPAGALAAQVDWTATPLGPPSTWPPALRSAVDLCFSTRFPVMIAWGPELTMIYNDGYRAMLGTDKHPGAMGAPARAVWAEIWDDIGPLFASVQRSAEPTWTVDQPLFMERSGYVEETYFTFSYSPLRDDDGVVRGVLDIATETTDQVVDRRRLALLSRLSRAVQEHGSSPARIAQDAVDVLRGSTDVVRARVWFATPGGPALVASSDEPGRAVPATDAVPDDLVRLVLSDGVARATTSALVAALPGPGPLPPVGVVVLEPGAYRPFDAAAVAFFQLLVSTLAAAVSDAVARERELRDLRSASDALQRAMLPDELTSHRWTTRYRPADDRFTVGGDWYDVVPLGPARWALLVGDCVGHGLHAASLMGQLRSAGRALLLDDAGPAAAVSGLDRFAAELPGAEYATVFCGIVDETEGTLTYTSAGHPPGLLVRAGEAHWLDGARGAPLTLSTSAGRTEERVVLEETDVVLLYTDGLVERRGESLRTGLARLAATAVEVVATRARQDVADALVAQLVGSAARDDVAVVVYGAGAPPEQPRAPERADAVDVGGRW